MTHQDTRLSAGNPAPDPVPADPVPSGLVEAVERGLRADHRGFRDRLAGGQAAEALVLLGLKAPEGPAGGAFWLAFGDALVALGCDGFALPAYRQALPALAGAARAQAMAGIGLCLAAAGRVSEGEVACGQARGLAPHLPALHTALGRVRLLAGRIDGAERAIRHALKLAPGDPAALAALAAVLARRGESDAALRQIDEAIATARDGRRLQLQKARLLAAAGDWPAAGRLAQQLAADWPWSAAPHRIAAQAALMRGEAAAAIAPAAQAAALSPEEPEVFALWSEALRLAGQPAQAAQAAARGLQLHPQAARLHAALGMALMGAGQAGQALAALREAARLAPDDQVLASNLLASLAASGAYDEVLERGRVLLAREDMVPEVAREARILLGRVLLHTGRAEEARDVLAPFAAAAPDLALLHARALRQSGRRAEAVAALRRILAAQPAHAGAAAELAAVAASVRDWPMAEAALQRALQAAPDDAELCGLMGETLRRAGRPAEALTWFLRAHRQAPQDWRHRRACGECLSALSASEARLELESLTSRALAEAWARPKDLAPMAVSLLRLSPKSAWLFEAGRPEPAQLSGLAAMSLMLRLLHATPVPDWAFEQAVLRLRRTLLDSVTGRGLAWTDEWLKLAAALADHCWLTDYALAESAGESAVLEELGRRLVAEVEQGRQPAVPAVVIAAAYRNLGRLPGAARLLSAVWPDPVLPLLRRHLEDPPRERQMAAALPSLGEPEDPVSRTVMAHYDRAPYPRWSSVPLPPPGERGAAGQSLQAALRARFPMLPADVWPRSAAPDLLDAGCGTGQLTLELAASYRHGSFTAVDLSRRALAYAARKCAEAGIGSVRFVQGDILRLPAAEGRYDAVNAIGLLHHLADPAAGWRALTAVTRPGGVQRIGIYSRLGRQPVAAGRQALAGLVQGDPDDAALRRVRPLLLERVDPDTRAALTRAPDFYALGSFRDMLLHVQEHVFDLGQVAALLRQLGLEFLGFDLADPAVYSAYAAFAPDDLEMRDLARWADFEAQNPTSFRGMYVFWVRKPG